MMMMVIIMMMFVAGATARSADKEASLEESGLACILPAPAHPARYDIVLAHSTLPLFIQVGNGSLRPLPTYVKKPFM
jgi:hypothetical protein